MHRLIVLLLILPFTATAEVVVPMDEVENNVNIRMEPDAKADIVGRLNQGEWVSFVSAEGGWNEIELPGGGTGYISATWTKVLDEPPATGSTL